MENFQSWSTLTFYSNLFAYAKHMKNTLEKDKTEISEGQALSYKCQTAKAVRLLKYTSYWTKHYLITLNLLLLFDIHHIIMTLSILTNWPQIYIPRDKAFSNKNGKK